MGVVAENRFGSHVSQHGIWGALLVVTSQCFCQASAFVGRGACTSAGQLIMVVQMHMCPFSAAASSGYAICPADFVAHMMLHSALCMSAMLKV